MKNTSLLTLAAIYALILFVLHHECAENQTYYACSVYLHVLVMLVAVLPSNSSWQWRALLCVFGCLGFLVHIENMRKPDIRIVDIGSVQVLYANADNQVDSMTRTLSDGTEYKGRAVAYNNGLYETVDFDGRVTVKWTNGDSLNGFYEKGKLKSGRLYSKEGKFVYDGELQENIALPRFKWLEGNGILYGDSSKCCKGLFSKGICGSGIFYENGGKMMNINNDKDHMQTASFSLPTRNVYVGNFEDNKETGYGRYYYKEGGYYQGFFEMGKCTGEGALYDSYGNLIGGVSDENVFPDDLMKKLEASRRTTGESSMAQAEKQNRTEKANTSQKKEVAKKEHEASAKNLVADGLSKTSIEEAKRRNEMPYYSLSPVEIRKLVSNAGKKFERVKFEEFHPLSDEPGERIKDKTGKVERYMEGEKVVVYGNGDRYTGQWHNGLRHGHGKMNYANGDIYEGDWVNGQRTGKGEYLTADRQRFVGDFVNGELHGMAVHYDDPTRKIIYNGRWEKGKTVSSKAKR